ncbi:glycosyltransferase [Paenibacillus glycanilyticus]|uniref:glycosyltransferase n=1 Tax=Paenibacillus glycanilyticus TaxID=126569 RepID=UPI001910B7DB|nr:glycosyltransferase [Paenibacillus glycanilyticus]
MGKNLEGNDKNVIIYISMFYPYDYKGETFLATEIDFLKRFEQKRIAKFILPIWANRNEKKKIDIEDLEVIDSVPNYSKYHRILWCIFALADNEFYKEMARLLKSNRLSVRNLIKLLAFTGQGNFIASHLKRYIKDHIQDLPSSLTLYSYWLHLQAYAAVKVSKKLRPKIDIRSISRGHRFDVYEYAAGGYIPFRNYILNGLDEVHSISQDGVNYLTKNYNFDQEKLKISRLGTEDNGIRISPKGICLKLLSCSWMRPVKRNGLILEALKELDFEVEWTHIGDGEEFNKIQSEISKLSNKKIKCNLLGNLNNEQVINYYKENDFNVFINVSSNEGVPVSIMEAMSFGKVILATDVGGTREIVKSGSNGLLLPEQLSSNELAEKIKEIFEMSEEAYINMCYESRDIWQRQCNSQRNYVSFYSDLLVTGDNEEGINYG